MNSWESSLQPLDQTTSNQCTRLIKSVLVYCMCKKLRRWSESGGSADPPWVRWPNTEAGASPLLCGGPIGVVECGYEAFKFCIWVATGMVGPRIHVLFHLSLWSSTGVEPMDGCALDCVSCLGMRIGEVALVGPGWATLGRVDWPDQVVPSGPTLSHLPLVLNLWCFCIFSCISKDLQVLVEPYEFENNVPLWCWLFFHFWCSVDG
jgi:hypothetical protein